jgi:hypothetical protein
MAISRKWHSRLVIGLVGGVMLPCLICSCALGYIAWTQYLQPAGLVGHASPDAVFEAPSPPVAGQAPPVAGQAPPVAGQAPVLENGSTSPHVGQASQTAAWYASPTDDETSVQPAVFNALTASGR